MGSKGQGADLQDQQVQKLLFAKLRPSEKDAVPGIQAVGRARTQHSLQTKHILHD